MTTPNSSVAFSQRDKALIDDFRAHGGAVTQGVHTGRTVLLLTTTGAKTGEPRIAPLVYTRDGDSYVIVGSKGGAPAHPAWYHNLVADPVVTVEVGRETIAAQATVTEGAERDRLFAAHVAEFPYFAGYQKKTSRVIPVVLLERIGQTRNGPAADAHGASRGRSGPMPLGSDGGALKEWGSTRGML
jgi:deazaflavin-dependent oxidoreductase (nitroreductase family)